MPLAGDVPSMQMIPYRVELQVREEDQSHRSGAAEQNNRASRTIVHECSSGHGNGNGREQSGAWP